MTNFFETSFLRDTDCQKNLCVADNIKNLKKDLNGVPVVVAYHDLKGTPSSEEIANILKKEIDAGGDVAKIVVKANSQADVLRFLNGTLEFRTKNPASISFLRMLAISSLLGVPFKS